MMRTLVCSILKKTQQTHCINNRRSYFNFIIARKSLALKPSFIFEETIRYQYTMSKTEKKYGEWVSPITSAAATASAKTMNQTQLATAQNGDEFVFWTEMRYEEGGRYVIMSYDVKNGSKQEWTPKEMSARTIIHEYGGGDMFVGSGPTLYFSNFTDQCLYKQAAASSAPEALTPADSGYRFADGYLSPKTGMIYIVREDHSQVKNGSATEPTNSIVCINPTTQQQTVLACGFDFCSSPKVSEDGKKICWVQWNHPNMPWDSTSVWIADLNGEGSGVVEGTPKQVAGGDDVSVMHPSWTPEGDLLYVSDQTNWWNLYRLNVATGETRCLHTRSFELGGPAWQFGNPPYMRRDSQLLLNYGKKLLMLKKEGDVAEIPSTDFNSYSHCQLNSAANQIYSIASSPSQTTKLISLKVSDGKVEVIATTQELSIPPANFSRPEHITFPTTDGAEAHGFLYLPMNAKYIGPADEKPPLLVKAHGGPTSSCRSALNLRIQYFTSRGFAVLDTNYRGSTGYGRTYRNALRMNWGVHDFDDCCNGAKYLADKSLVDGDRLCIDGGSAGGYTTLGCLAFRDTFKAGASHYGVADLEMLTKETHKFESRYLDNLVGPYPADRDTYLARSPIHNISGFTSPVIFFQGDEDMIVPPNQAELMFESLKARKVPTALVMFKGEQHGFRKSENVQLALDGEFYFFSRVFNFTPAELSGVSERITIINL